MSDIAFAYWRDTVFSSQISLDLYSPQAKFCTRELLTHADDAVESGDVAKYFA